ncbi:MAG: hypothetical protein ACYCXW_16555, partial [Solirubrobacteraceae bacterium]
MADPSFTHPEKTLIARLPIDVLDDDWRRLLADAGLRSRFAAWRRAEPALASFASPAALIAFLHSPGDRDVK